MSNEFHIEDGYDEVVVPTVEHQFIPSFPCKPHREREETTGLNNLQALKDESEEEIYVSLQLGEPDQKRRKQSNSTS